MFGSLQFSFPYYNRPMKERKKKDTKKKTKKKQIEVGHFEIIKAFSSFRLDRFFVCLSTLSKIERYDSLSRGGHDVVKMNLCPTDIFIRWTRTLKLRSLLHNAWFKSVNKSSMH